MAGYKVDHRTGFLVPDNPQSVSTSTVVVGVNASATAPKPGVVTGTIQIEATIVNNMVVVLVENEPKERLYAIWRKGDDFKMQLLDSEYHEQDSSLPTVALKKNSYRWIQMNNKLYTLFLTANGVAICVGV